MIEFITGLGQFVVFCIGVIILVEVIHAIFKAM